MYFLCCDIGGTNLKMCVARDFTIIEENYRTLPLLYDAKKEINIITEVIDNLISLIKRKGYFISCISIVFGASLDKNTGDVISWPNRPYWIGVNLSRILKEKYRTMIITEDDANGAAIGEFYMADDHETDSLAFITIGTGLGCGLILNGDIYRGSQNCAGEIGHITFKHKGKPCPCGKRGCLQTLVSGKALFESYKEKSSDKDLMNIDDFHISEKAELGDILAQRILSEAALYLGIALANLTTLLDIDSIIIGGGVVENGNKFLELINEIVKTEVNGRRINISKSKLGPRAGIIGAICLANMKVRQTTKLFDFKKKNLSINISSIKVY